MDLTKQQHEERMLLLRDTLVRLLEQKDILMTSIAKIEETLMGSYHVFILSFLRKDITPIQQASVMAGIQDMEKLVGNYEVNLRDIQELRLKALEEYHSLCS